MDVLFLIDFVFLLHVFDRYRRVLALVPDNSGAVMEYCSMLTSFGGDVNKAMVSAPIVLGHYKLGIK